MLRACPHHEFTKLAQIDTFYNGLNDNDQDSLNAATGENLLSKTTREALQIIKNKLKVCYSRNKPNVFKMNTTSRENASKTDDRIDKLADQILTLVDIFAKKVVTPAPIIAVEESYVTCGGAHAYYNCPNTDSNQPSICVAMGTYNQVAPQNRASNYMAPPFLLQCKMVKIGTLSSNTIPNPKREMKAITTRSGVAYEGTSIPTPKKVMERETEETMDKEQTNFQGSTADIQPPVTPISEPDVLKTLPKPNIPYPSRLNDQKLCEKATNQMENLLTNKDKLFELAKIPLNENYSPMLLKKLPEKLGYSGKFLIPCDIPGMDLSLPELTPTRMTLELADRSITRPKGVAEFVKVGKFHFSTDFVVVDFEADPRVPLILGRSFLRTDRALNDVYGEEITLQVNDEAVTLNLNQTMRYSSTYDDLSQGEVVKEKSSIEEPPKLELKDLPSHLEYAYLEGVRKLPVIISKDLKVDEKEALLKVLKSHKRQLLRKSPTSRVIKKEVIKLLDAGMIYPISDSSWVIPIHCVPKKGGITVVKNENNELIHAQLVTGWRVCIDYRKLNDVTRKYHFPLLFMDQMLERLAGNEFYCFLDGFFGYFQIPINPPDQEKTTFTCPYGTFAYRRMPFGLCNAPGTFQRCVMVIFHDMIKKTIEVFMDDFLVFGDSFSSCLSHLDTMLQRCEDTSLVLNWEKCHFMVKEKIVLGHKISKNGFEVNRSKVDIIAKLPYPTTMKGVRSFLGHAGFYQRFIQDFSKIARPITHLLEKETPFVFSKDSIDAFETLKKKLTEAPILVILQISMRGILLSNGCLTSKRRYSLRMLNITSGMIPTFFGYVRIKSFEGVCMAKKLMISSKLVIKDPPGAIMVPILAPRKYILVAVDYLSKWVEAKLLPTNDARAIVKFLKSLFTRFETPRAIISDPETHFGNDKFAKVMSKYGVTHRLATTYHPQTRGQVEVSNRGLKHILERTVGENCASWSEKLDDALWAFRTAYKTPIGCTPYKLFYGKSCHLPIELEHKAYWALKHVNFDLKTTGDHRKLQLNELNELRDQAYKNSLIYKEKTNKIHDSKIKNRIFNVGDQALLFNSHLKIFSGKLKTRWSGPFTITKVFPYGTIELSQPDGPNFKVNGHRVKHYFGGDVPQLVVPDLQTFPMDK
uniref:DNA-directed DNA polymerase n=1 Tax=Tanacetum cinerariifolium TaxID=118510 RepID=A0A6L2J908_TANCI|nr:DNA-directed DNA polymerase [Tanacetum cinerariifolium]